VDNGNEIPGRNTELGFSGKQLENEPENIISLQKFTVQLCLEYQVLFFSHLIQRNRTWYRR